MKCKFIRDDIEVNPAATTPEVIGELCVLKKLRRNRRDVMRPHWKVGAIFEHPQAYVMVMQGMAIPADKECEERANMTADEMAAAQRAYDKLAKGIHPEDNELFDAGVIAGYDEKGEYLPGPNWHLMEESAEQEIDSTPITATGDDE